MPKLDQKVCLITGAANGIGKAIAKQFAREGAILCLEDIDESHLREVQAEVKTISGQDCLLSVGDATKLSFIAETIDKVDRTFGRLDVLVNDVGGSLNHSIHLLDLTEAQWDQLLDLNVKTTFFHSQYAIRLMLRAGKGVIVNLASQAGRRGNEHSRPHYSASKSAIMGLTRHMAREFGPQGIRVNASAPGHCISSDRLRAMWEERERQGTAAALVQAVALRRVSSVEEQAKVIVFLASDDSSYITGTTVDVGGGITCV